MPFSKFVEIGRVAYIDFGKDCKKICTIVDVIDQNRALVDGPCSGVQRQPMPFKRLHLTKFRIKFPHSASTSVVRKAWTKANVNESWAETSRAKKRAAIELKSKISDFERFQLMKAKQTRNRVIQHELFRLKRLAKKNPVKPKRKRHARKPASIKAAAAAAKK